MQIHGQPRAGEDLSTEIDLLMGTERDMKFLSLVNFLPKNFIATSDKHEWQDDRIDYETVSFTASAGGADWDTNNDITGLPVADAERAKLRVGDVLKLALPAAEAGELVVVKSIDDSGDTIDLWARGHGSTTATAQGAVAFTAKLVGNVQLDGSDPATAYYQAPTARYNRVQIFERDLAISGKVMRSKISKESERSRQRMIKLKSLLSQLNAAMWEGFLEEDSTNDVYTFRGIREAGSTTYNINGALTVAHVYGVVEAMINAGGSPSALHGSPTIIGRLERLMSTYVTSGVSEFNAKLTVNKIHMHGIDIEIHADRHCTNTELWALDYGRLAYGPQSSDEASGEFSAVVTAENGKQIKEQITGYFTMEEKQPAAAIVKGYGCTS